MHYVDTDTPLWNTLASIAKDEGLRLYDIEQNGRGSLRVYISKDSAGGVSETNTQAGVSAGDCSKFLERLVVLFTAEGNSLGCSNEPQIEVSSPGINRNLRLVEHFEGAVGQRLKVISAMSLESRNGNGQSDTVVIGKLLGANKDSLLMEVEDKKSEIELQLSLVKKAHVNFKF